MDQKGFAQIIILLIVAGILAIGGTWFYEANQSIPSQSLHNVGQSSQTSTRALNPESSSVKPAPSIGATTSFGATSRTTGTVSAVSTSSWLTYSDPPDGFSFQYPPDCELNTSTYEGIGIIAFYKCPLDGLAIDTYHKRSDQAVLDFWQGTTGLIVVSSAPMTIHGYPALQIEDQMAPFTEGDLVATSDLLVIKNNTFFVGLAPSPFDAPADNNDPIPEAILDTLRF